MHYTLSLIKCKLVLSGAHPRGRGGGCRAAASPNRN